MGVDYRKQYKPDQLEPFWPNEIVRMIIVVLCTLAVIMVLVTLPTVLEWAGVHGLAHEEEPANPRVTPPHIKPEWYFLASYQYLKIMEYPQRWFGIDGKMLGIMSQGVFVVALLTLPLWYRRGAYRRGGVFYLSILTLIVIVCLILTVAAIWPPSPLFLALMIVAVVVFTALMIQEQRAVNRHLGPDRDADRESQP